MRKKDVFRKIRDKGYQIQSRMIDFRIDDCTNWYNCDMVLSAVKEIDVSDVVTVTHGVYLYAVGDIRIYGKRESNHFVYKGGNPSGYLTSYLKKNGEWENNNWFEISESIDTRDLDGDQKAWVEGMLEDMDFEMFEEGIQYSLTGATEEFLERLK